MEIKTIEMEAATTRLERNHGRGPFNNLPPERRTSWLYDEGRLDTRMDPTTQYPQ